MIVICSKFQAFTSKDKKVSLMTLRKNETDLGCMDVERSYRRIARISLVSGHVNNFAYLQSKTIFPKGKVEKGNLTDSLTNSLHFVNDSMNK